MKSILFEILRISGSRFKCSYLKNETFFLKFWFFFWNIHQILNILKKIMIVIAITFPILQTVKFLVKPISKKLHFRTSFDSQYIKSSQTLVESWWEHFHNIFSSLWGELIWKISPLAIWKILAVFVNTLTPDDRYPLPDYENLALPIQMQLS